MAKLQAKVKALEKDLYYYKKTSRDLKRQASQQQRGSVDRGVGPGLRPQELGSMETQDSKGMGIYLELELRRDSRMYIYRVFNWGYIRCT